MSTLSEIEAALEQLPVTERQQLQERLATRLAARPQRGLTPEEFEAWLENARRAPRSGLTTDEIMALTRGDE